MVQNKSIEVCDFIKNNSILIFTVESKSTFNAGGKAIDPLIGFEYCSSIDM